MQLPEARDRLLFAWTAHDHWALSMSPKKKGARIKKVGHNEGALQTDRLLDAQDEYAAQLGITSLECSRRRQELRRQGVTHEDCLLEIEEDACCRAA